MGVLTNGFRDTIGVFRTYGGTALNNCYPQGTRGNYARTGMMRNITAGEGITDDMVGVPMGYADRGWIMPQKGGMISARTDGITFSATGNGLRGLPGTGTASFSIDFAAAAGELIVSGAGTASFTISTNTPLLTASLGGTGAASFSITTNNPILGAEASGIGSASFTISATLTPYAVGHMEGTTEEAGLTPSGIANAVWGKAIEAGYTADQILRILSAHAAGAATGLEGANPQFVGLDGSTVRIDGTYSAGTRTIDALDGS